MADFIKLCEKLTVSTDTISSVQKSEKGDFNTKTYYDKMILVNLIDGRIAKIHYYDNELERDKEYSRITKELISIDTEIKI